MSITPVQRAAIWLLGRAGCERYSAAMCGDLLEELERTGATGRFWREVLTGMGVALRRRAGAVLQPVLFSTGWSLLYPMWWRMGESAVWSPLAQRSFAMNWPLSSVTLLASAGLPALLFVWLGTLMWVGLSRREGNRGPGWTRTVLGLSLSLSVLLISAMAMHSRAGETGRPFETALPGVRQMPGLSLPLALSLLVATSFTRPQRLRTRTS